MAVIKVKKIKTEEEYMHALQIRYAVFCNEQHIDTREELDSKDKEAIHYILLVDQKYVGTCRVLKMPHYYLISRLAILNEYRQHHYGSTLLQKVIHDILKINRNATIELHSQIKAVPFYEKNGFETYGIPFIEAHQEHIGMKYQKPKEKNLEF